MGTVELSAIVFGLFSAACWGTADFSGGLATKRTNVFTVVVVSQIVGAVFLLGIALLSNEQSPTIRGLLWGASAGLFGAMGLTVFYKALAIGRMGVVAPVVGVVTATTPVILSMFIEGLPTARQFIGFVLAMIAMWFVSSPEGFSKIEKRDVVLATFSGICFSGFLILIDRVEEGSVFWPLVAARTASLTFLTSIALYRRELHMPSKERMPTISSAGIFDTGGNVFFTLATQAGRLDIAAVLSTVIYPAITVTLALVLLKESITRTQLGGIVGAMIAITMIIV